jgi:hypothetical protein
LFRAVYATIAAHWFCPPTVSDLEFRAYIQGHFQILNETSAQKRTSMAAQRHYWDYKIDNGQGNVDGRLGIKLQEPEVQVLSAFDRQSTTTKVETHGTKVHLRVFDDDRTALAQIQSQFDLPSRAAANHFVIELATSLLNTAQVLNITPQQLIAQLQDLAQGSDREQTDLFEQRSETMPLGLSPSKPESISQDFSEQTQENQDFSVASEQNEEEMTTEEQLDPGESQTVTHQDVLFERIEQQQQSMENLTRAIHGLVEVLAQTQSPSPSSSSISVPTEAEQRGLGGFPHERLFQEAVSQSGRQPKPSDAPVIKPTESVSQNPSSRKRRGEISRQKVNQYIDAIMTYNDVPDRLKSDKWLITIAALKRLTHCGQSVIYDVLSQRETDIQFHHHKHQLGLFHNQKGRNAHKIESLLFLT